MSSESFITHLKFSPNILKRLGEELTSNVDQGIIELVKNSYDADSTECEIKIENAKVLGGTISVADDGDGMKPEQVDYGWLLLGDSKKVTKTRTNGGRIPVGDKGLGRLAALRAGTSTTLTTRPRSEPGVEYSVTIDWENFDRVLSVEQVPIEIVKQNTTLKHGTTICINGLKNKIDDRDAERLARSLFLLADPFETDRGFKIRFDAPAFDRLQKLTVKDYFEQSISTLEANIDENGMASAIMKANGKTIKATHADIIGALRPKRRSKLQKENENDQADRPLALRNVTYSLWMFVRGGNINFAPAIMNRNDLNRWLDAVGNVHVFQSNIRVPPYGDPGDDWLGLNLRRAQDPQERPSTNNVIGRIVLPENNGFIQKTDRSGFVENEIFHQLKEFAQSATAWASEQRHLQAENRREAEKTPQQSLVDERAVRTAVTSLPVELREPVEKAFASYVSTTKRQASNLENELQLYRTLATVGTTTAVFIHDAAAPAQTISELAVAIIELSKVNLFSEPEKIAEAAEQIRKTTQFFQTFSGLPLKLLSSRKREPGEVSIHEALNEVMGMFKPVMDEMEVVVESTFAAGDPKVRASIAAIEAIYANLLTNAYHAVVEERADLSGRTIITETEIKDNAVIIRVLDNGPGIHGLTIEQIWLPGKTTKTNGVGLGLKIVRDVVRDLSGSVSAVAQSRLGGAEFIVRIPTTHTSGGR